jgi:hypothetical protein
MPRAALLAAGAARSVAAGAAGGKRADLTAAPATASGKAGKELFDLPGAALGAGHGVRAIRSQNQFLEAVLAFQALKLEYGHKHLQSCREHMGSRRSTTKFNAIKSTFATCEQAFAGRRDAAGFRRANSLKAIFRFSSVCGFMKQIGPAKVK